MLRIFADNPDDALAFTIDIMQNVGLTILRVNNTYGFRARIYFATAVLNIIVTILIVPQVGILGAAWATAGAMFLGNGLIMNWFYWKRTGIDIPRFWREICTISIAPFVLFAASWLLASFVLPAADGWLVLILYLVIYTVAYLAVCWLFSFNNYEKGLLQNLLGSVKGIVRKS